MATKATSKTAGKKPSARKTAAPKPAAAKTKLGSKKKEPQDTPATSTAPPPKGVPKPSSAPRREVESVSLIDEKKPKQKSVDGEVKKKTAVLPPISRIRASMETS